MDWQRRPGPARSVTIPLPSRLRLLCESLKLPPALCWKLHAPRKSQRTGIDPAPDSSGSILLARRARIARLRLRGPPKKAARVTILQIKSVRVRPGLISASKGADIGPCPKQSRARKMYHRSSRKVKDLDSCTTSAQEILGGKESDGAEGAAKSPAPPSFPKR